MGILDSIKRIFGKDSFNTTIDVIDPVPNTTECACGGNCTCGVEESSVVEEDKQEAVGVVQAPPAPTPTPAPRKPKPRTTQKLISDIEKTSEAIDKALEDAAETDRQVKDEPIKLPGMTPAPTTVKAKRKSRATAKKSSAKAKTPKKSTAKRKK